MWRLRLQFCNSRNLALWQNYVIILGNMLILIVVLFMLVPFALTVFDAISGDTRT